MNVVGQYVRLGTVIIPEVIEKVLDPTIIKAEFHGKRVGVTGARLLTFSRSCTCYMCGKEAEYFAVETHNRRKSDINEYKDWHLNLYDKDDLLFTADHVIPKCFGGADSPKNLKTACSTCNYSKGNGLKVDAPKTKAAGEIAWNVNSRRLMRRVRSRYMAGMNIEELTLAVFGKNTENLKHLVPHLINLLNQHGHRAPEITLQGS